jgi:hypothetical protein
MARFYLVSSTSGLLLILILPSFAAVNHSMIPPEIMARFYLVLVDTSDTFTTTFNGTTKRETSKILH